MNRYTIYSGYQNFKTMFRLNLNLNLAIDHDSLADKKDFI